VRNANDGISMLQTAEGATQEITNMLQRMRELAVQAANDTNSTADRSALQLEADELTEEIERIFINTQWNGMNILDASGSNAVGSAGDVILQVGINNSSDDTIGIDFGDFTYSDLAISGDIDLSSNSDAQDALDTLDDAIAFVDEFRAKLGAKMNRLSYAADNLTNISTNTAASRSRILDADYASVTTELARSQIIQQAATAMLAQANQMPQTVLSLLK